VPPNGFLEFIKSRPSDEAVIELTPGKKHPSILPEGRSREGRGSMEPMASVKPQAGDAAPELHFLARDGEKRQLSKLWAEGPALVLWLRHLG
jgi:hypothetical protein